MESNEEFENEIIAIQEKYNITLHNDGYGYRNNKKIPEIFYINECVFNFYTVSFYCRKNDNVYQSFFESGLLHKFYPKWYRNGFLSQSENDHMLKGC
jgi:hypothetical protein